MYIPANTSAQPSQIRGAVRNTGENPRPSHSVSFCPSSSSGQDLTHSTSNHDHKNILLTVPSAATSWGRASPVLATQLPQPVALGTQLLHLY